MDPKDYGGIDTGDFELITSQKANNLIDVRKYKSKKTGLTVVIAQVEGPIVNGYFTLATETYDDDGLPHTLEHLIFLGSEDYPYKGVLDLLANQMLASGSNAWTDIDHTCYTVTTAGSEGFLSLLPIYVDHILYPTLTDAAFTTEVHHIDGEGKDAGVAYCEMQGVENTGETLVHKKMTTLLYPGKCGYSVSTGGKLQNFRESTTNEKVKNFHKEFYRPDNLTLIITGQVNDTDVFKALKPVEDKILSKGALPPFQRPWQSPVPEFTESQDVMVKYGADEEYHGMVFVGWRGPSAVTDLYEMSACTLLLKYLTYTSISPLGQEFVEVDDPFASNVSFSVSENSVTALYIIFVNVPVPKLGLVKDKLFQCFQAIYEGKDPFNMTRMKTVIHKEILESLLILENDPHNSVAFMIIGDFLYGNTLEDFRQRLNPVEHYERLEKEPEEFWKNLLKKYFIDSPCVVVKGNPSMEERERLAKEEEERVAKQKEALGLEGLLQKQKELDAAIVKNEIPPPEEMLTKLPRPDVQKIKFHSITSYSTNTNRSDKLDFQKCPVYMYFDDLNTNFVYIKVLMDTEKIPIELRPYLLLFMETILESPIMRGDVLIPYEEVIAECEGDTVSIFMKLGLGSNNRFSCGLYCHMLCLEIQVEPSKYEKAVNWVDEFLYKTVFTKERLKIMANKIISDVSQAKRRGNKVVSDLMKGIRYDKDCNHYWSNMLRQQKFLSALVERMEMDSEWEQIHKDMETVRAFLTNPSNMVIHMGANLNSLSKKYTNVLSPWSALRIGEANPVRDRFPVKDDHSYKTPEDRLEKNGVIVGLGCIESSFFSQTVSSIVDFTDPDLPALLVFLQYLTQLEGTAVEATEGTRPRLQLQHVPGPQRRTALPHLLPIDERHFLLQRSQVYNRKLSQTGYGV
ncbi:UNVERIFIED_CONTAM: hypothetical protein PYX00_006371 [Menopon gallinae]|uniref:Peptidase M16C associated domain-containing protein n=1 Tax=Menopon gallinae TaxID=328185 RepID=A0AAW2HWM8_9NEOP